ncbi:hypothetical protein KJ782_07225 [Patescibacteria group bacterium]|nr:hypothetical protein [Patescibacteria group bacterium]
MTDREMLGEILTAVHAVSANVDALRAAVLNNGRRLATIEARFNNLRCETGEFAAATCDPEQAH